MSYFLNPFEKNIILWISYPNLTFEIQSEFLSK